MQRRLAYLPILLATALAGLGATRLSAHEGHDHGPPLPAPVAAVLAPRVTAESADLELVAVLEDGTLTVYLDEFATNLPIEDAVLQVDSGAWQSTAVHEGDGVYRLDPGPLAEPGRHDLIFNVESPTTGDLLLGTLVVPDDTNIATQPAGGSTAWYASVPLLQGAVVILALCSLALLLWRDHRGRGVPGEQSGPKRPPKGSASSTKAAMMSLAFLATTLLTLDAFGPVGAHEGHDHGAPDSARDPTPAAACAAGQAATRLPDGSLFVPKPIQRLLGIRTARAEPGVQASLEQTTGSDPHRSRGARRTGIA